MGVPARKIWCHVIVLSVLSTLVASPVWSLPVARLRNTKPQVQVKPEGKRFVSSRARSALRFGDIVRTDKKGKADLLFTNGTRVTMRENSQIQIVAPAQKNSPMVIRVFGALSEVFVRPKGNTQVRTAAAIAAARGTAFLVRLPDENTTVVTVTEDEVDFFNEQGAVLLAAGQQSTAVVGSAPTPPVAVDASGLTAWTADIATLPVEYEMALETTDAGAARALIGPREAALASAQGANKTSAQLALGRALYDAGEYARAAALFEEITRAEPQNASAWAGLGAAQRASGDPQSAVAAYGNALQRGGASTQARVGLALAHLERGDEPAVRDALAPVANQAAGLSVAGLMELRSGDYAAASKSFQSALEQEPNLHQTRSLFALSLLMQNDLERARGEARRAAVGQPDSAQAQGTLATVLFFSGREYFDDAARASRRAVQLNPFSAFALLAQGRLALADGDVDAARDAFGQAAALAPNLEITHTELGNAYLRQGRPASAQREFQRALAINPQSSAAQSGLAGVLAATGKDDDARAAYEGALAQNPDDANARAAYAAFLIEAGEFDAARAQLDQGVIAAPERGILYARLSEVALFQQNFKDAETYARRAVGLLPDSSLTHYQLGRVYLELERTVQALEQFRIAVRLDRENAAARYALGFTRELVESGRDPSRPRAAAQGNALVNSSRLLNLQDFQSPGAEDRLQALAQDPTVLRSATRSIGDTELKAVIGEDGTKNLAASHLNLSGDKRTVIGVTAQRDSFDEVQGRNNSDFTDDRFSALFGRKAKDNPSSFFVMGDYEQLEEGLNKGDQLPFIAPSRVDAKRPRFIVGGNWQKSSDRKTRALLQYSSPESRLVNPLFGDRQDIDGDSFNAEVRHDRRIGRQHYLSAGLFAGKREQENRLFIAGFPPFFPDLRSEVNVDARYKGAYIRDEYQANRKLALIGEIKVVRLDIDNTFQIIEPAPLPAAQIVTERTQVIPTFIMDYSPTPQTGIRFRARRVFGGIRDFQLLSPKDTFLTPLNDLPQLAIDGRGTSLELEGSHTFRNGSFARLGIFQQSLHDLQEPTSDGSGVVIPRARLRGVRAGYEGNISSDLSFFLNVARTSARDLDRDEQIVNVPAWTGEAGLQYLNEDGWFVQPSAYLQSRRRRTNGESASGFSTFNLRAGKRFGLRSMVFVEVVNITDQQFDIREVLQSGRQFRVGVIGRF